MAVCDMEWACQYYWFVLLVSAVTVLYSCINCNIDGTMLSTVTADPLQIRQGLLRHVAVGMFSMMHHAAWILHTYRVKVNACILVVVVMVVLC